MSNVKEKIIGAVTIMNEKDAQKVWELIQGTFILNNAEEVEPDPDELEILKAYESGEPEYQPAISQADLMKELGI